MSARVPKPAAFSVDVEEHRHAELVRRHLGAQVPPGRVERATTPILDLLEHLRMKATFFIVGEVLREAPRLVERIAAAGHEIGCHTFTHKPLWDHDPESFRKELRQWREALHAVVPGLEAWGFRAPTFSLDLRTSWALRVLAEEGFRYDSSIVPAKGPLYGCPGAPFAPYRPSLDDILRVDPEGPIVEFPAPIWTLGPLRLPVGGGIYLRVLPFRIYRALFTRVLRQRPCFLYVHPWETDPETPRVPIPGPARWATYHGIRRMLEKLERMAKAIPFVTMEAALAASGHGVRNS